MGVKPPVNHLSVRPALLGLVLAIALVASSCASPSEDGGQSSASGSGATAPPTAVVEPAVVEEALAGQATLVDVRRPVFLEHQDLGRTHRARTPLFGGS